MMIKIQITRQSNLVSPHIYFKEFLCTGYFEFDLFFWCFQFYDTRRWERYLNDE